MFNKLIAAFFSRFLSLFGLRVSKSLDYLQRERSLNPNYADYIRLATLELISHEINSNQLVGNVAEVGVYKGKFAQFINQYFPNRSLYLFDTFEGFNNQDIQIEKNKGFSDGEQDFSNTSIDSVLSIMPFKEKCIVKKGFFPESAKGIEDQFVFVSLDTDLYQPIVEGLNYFYPRLASGGAIFIHDYNNDLYPGSKKAVLEFCKAQKVSYIPLPDSGGSAIIRKP